MTVSRFALPCCALLACASFAQSQSGTAQLSTPRNGSAAAELMGKAYLAGSDDLSPTTVDVYDSTDGSWEVLELGSTRGAISVGAAGGKVLFAGGVDPVTFEYTTLVEILDVQTGDFTRASLSTPRAGCVSATVGDLVLFAAGSIWGNGSPAVDIYDASTGAWRVDQLSTTRAQIAGTSSGDRAYFAGGTSWVTPASSRVDIFDASTGSWSTAELSEGRMAMAAAAVGDKVLFAGGLRGDNVSSSRVDILDTSTGIWSTAELSQPRQGLAATTVGSKVFFGGGLELGVAYSTTLDVYDDATGTWSVRQLSVPRTTLAGVTAGGLALFAGGGAGMAGVVDVVDLVPGDDVLIAYCFGDGSGAACPCGNPGAAGEGCANSTGAGAVLGTTGWVSVSQDDLTLEASQLPAGVNALAFAGQSSIAGGAGAAFGDGLRCAGGGVVRLGVGSANGAGLASFGPGLAALGGWSAGDVRYLQVWYRDPVGGPCSSGSNLSSAIEAHLLP